MEKGYLIVIAVLILIILVLAAYLFFYKMQLIDTPPCVYSVTWVVYNVNRLRKN